MKKIILPVLLFLVTGAWFAMQAQSPDVEAKYLQLFSASFTSKDTSHRATNLFWSLCLGDTGELSNETLGRRYTELVTDTNARIRFYKRFNYYLSGNTGYYSDLLAITVDEPEKKSKEKTEPPLPFTSDEMTAFVARVSSYGQDPLLAGSWNSGPESLTGSPLPISEPRIFTYVEQMPVFPGGEQALIRFLVKHIVYPGMERDKDIQGKILIKFRVCEDGYLCTASAVRTVTQNLETEGMRVLKMMPHWKPGKQQGENVSVWFMLPIVFKLQ